MDLVAGLRLKGARERAWLVGDPTWMRRWLLERANAGQRSSLELKSRFGAKCGRERAAAHRHRVMFKTLPPPHWDFQDRVPPGNGKRSGRFTRMAGDVPTPDTGSDKATETSEEKIPKVPKKKPSLARDRNPIIKELAKFGAKLPGNVGRVFKLIEAIGWLKEFEPIITSYWDPPKSLEELQAAALDPKAGYDIHHIAEQASARKFGFSDDLIDGPANLVRIPRLKHHEINGWFSRSNIRYGSDAPTPREYFRMKDWEERTKIGKEILFDVGVLKP